jgi:histidyl-tRNA synthetase
MKHQTPRGTNDILPGAREAWLDSWRWTELERAFREHVALFGYSEVRTPIFEDYELFARSAGETTDIVSKEMYDFTDKGDRHIALRPELTAPVMRALIQHSLCAPGTVARLSYMGPIFRYERPQKGRYRQAHQFGLELVGSSSVAADAEVIEVTVQFYRRLGISDAAARVSSLGRAECRSRFRAAILDHARHWLENQPLEIQDKTNKNPLRLLDSKDPETQEALKGLRPVTDFLEDESRMRFEGLQEILTAGGIPFEVDTAIVRGLDYYTETVFEIHSPNIGAQSALCGGGRYDDLIRELGGSNLPSVGVGMGVERCLLVMEAMNLLKGKQAFDVFIVQSTPDVFATVRTVASELRDAGIGAITDPDQKSMKSQMGQASRSGAKLAVIVKEEEINQGMVTVRNLEDGNQDIIPMRELIAGVKSRL